MINEETIVRTSDVQYDRSIVDEGMMTQDLLRISYFLSFNLSALTRHHTSYWQHKHLLRYAPRQLSS